MRIYSILLFILSWTCFYVYCELDPSDPAREAEMSIVVCLQDDGSSCNGNGMTICYTPPHRLLFPLEDVSPAIQRLRDICDQKSGIVVTTETDYRAKRNYFRIDTVYGNSYRFPFPNHKCFVLWLTYDIFKDYGMDYEKMENMVVNSIFRTNDDQNLNATTRPLEFLPKWDHIMLDENGKPVFTYWKEFAIRPQTHSNIMEISFVAQGGDPCCALSARFSGEHLIKCYQKWVQIGDECRANYPGHETECEFHYTFGISDGQMSGNRNESSTRLAQDEKNELFKMLAQSKHGFYDRGNNDYKANLTHLQIGKGNSTGNNDDVAFNVHGKLTVNGSIPVIPGLLKIEVSASAEGAYAQRQYDAKLEKHGRGYVDHLEAENDVKRQNVTQQNVTTQIQERIANALSSNRRFNESSDAKNSSSSGTTEFHTVRNVVRWPDVLRKAQLHLVCLGFHMPLNTTEDFSNNAEVLRRVSEKERAVGYPDPSLYANCP